MKKILKWLIISFVSLFVSGLLILFFLPLPPLLEGISFSRAVYDSHHRLLRLTLSQDQKFRLYTPLSEIANQLKEATLLQEDFYFYQHVGINPWSLTKAVWQTYGAQSRRVGASTLTMQLARIRYGIHSRQISGKLLQIARALQIEMHYSKNEILEAYLNLVPYGGNIEGVGAASLIYFNTQASRLSLPEALTLSIIPQNPRKRTPNHIDLQHIRAHLFTRWLSHHPYDLNQKVLIDLPITMRTIAQLPFKAPHLVNKVLSDSSIKSLRIQTTLDLETQGIISRVTAHYLERKKANGVHNAAVLLVDTRDMSVKAMSGSADFFNQAISGQINGVETKRSPGSTLKPFIYGLALDQGLIHPNTVLKDVPHGFNGYNPENFDYDFMGPIKARDALVLSRNIPAVYLSSQLSNPSLHQLLENAQVSHLRPESYYGLSLNLGGVELTMRELVGLYAMLVNDGVWYPIHFLKAQTKQQGCRLLSQEASFLVLDMLKNTSRHDVGELGSGTVPVSWKTGTSSGYRDAWAVGAFGPYVLAVWIGNFNNQSNPAFVGKDIAAPLFFELIDAIKQEQGPIPVITIDPSLLHLTRVKVCKASGLLPTRHCPDTEWTWFIPGKSPIKTDNIYREIAINNKTGLRTCHVDQSTRFEVFEFWPSDLLKIFKRAGIQRRTPPFFEAGCALSGNDGMSPQILSPEKGIKYVLNLNSSQNNTIPFSAVRDAGVESLYWFVDETFVAKTKSDAVYLWKAKPGHFVIRAVDEHGLSDARDITVEMQ